MPKVMTNEFLIRYIDDFEDYQAILDTSCKKWNNVAKNQLRRKIKNLDDVLENHHQKTKQFEVAFQNGSKAHFLFIDKNISVFELHNELREAFLDGIKEYENISFNILGLSNTHQKILASSLTSLIYLCQWKWPTYGKKSKKKKTTHKNFGFYTNLENSVLSPLIQSGNAIAEGTNLVRTLAATPTNYMTPRNLTEEARKIAKKLGCSIKFLSENALKDLGAGCFLSVIQGSKDSGGGIVHIKYRTRKKDPANLALVGKGVTFDTGGYSIKTEGSMQDMHRDMTGAAVALASFQSLVKTKPRCNIDLYLAVGENLISEKSYKPNDVVVAMDGTAVEVSDTDAEGRMMLADTILYAKKQSPDIIVDFATLTGAAIYSIGNRYSCVMSNRDDLAQKAVKSGGNCGERVWHFPTSIDFTNQLFDTNVADIHQCVTSDDNADHIYAACFLQFFAGKTPWVHVDLSAEVNDHGLGLVDTTVTGFGVRWAHEFVNLYLKEKGSE